MLDVELVPEHSSTRTNRVLERTIQNMVGGDPGNYGSYITVYVFILIFLLYTYTFEIINIELVWLMVISHYEALTRFFRWRIRVGHVSDMDSF